MIALLLQIIILALVAGLIYWLVQMLPIAEPFATIVRVGVIVLCIVVLLGLLFGWVSLPVVRL